MKRQHILAINARWKPVLVFEAFEMEGEKALFHLEHCGSSGFMLVKDAALHKDQGSSKA